MNLKIIKQNCNDYLRARKKFLEFAKSAQAQGLLNGNDNIIGSRIGEFIAWELLNDQKRNPKINTVNNTRDFDLMADLDKTKVTVKLISSENRAGRINRLGNDWNEFILILLDEKYKIKLIGQISKKEFETARKLNPRRCKNPIVSRTMLNENGLFKFGKIHKENLEKYL